MERIIDKFENQPKNKAVTKNTQDSNTMVHTNRKVTQLEGGQYQKIGGMWNLKHDISLPKLYKLLLKTYLKVDTAIGINKFYNHIKMCLNEVIKLIEDLLPAYHQIKNSKFHEYFIPYRSHPYYYCNAHM